MQLLPVRTNGAGVPGANVRNGNSWDQERRSAATGLVTSAGRPYWGDESFGCGRSTRSRTFPDTFADMTDM